MLMRDKENLEPGMNPPGTDDMVMHASLRIGETMVLVSDGRCGGPADVPGLRALLSRRPSEAEAERLFAALADGGQVQMPLAKTFFSPRFGMVIDRFGVLWMILAAGNPL